MDKDEEIYLLKKRIESIEKAYKDILKWKEEKIEELMDEIAELSVKRSNK